MYDWAISTKRLKLTTIFAFQNSLRIVHLLRLPAEILAEIAAELNDEGDISRFSRTNTWLRSALDSFLYKFDAQIRHGKDKDAKGPSIVLHRAALFGKFGILDKALRAGANIDCIFSTGDVSLPS